MTRNSPWLTIGFGLAVLLTSGGFTRPGTPPEPDSSDAVIVTKTQYDDAGLPHIVTDNAGIQTRREYDALGRPRKVVENYVDGAPDDDFPDEDRVTTYTYNAAGQIVTQTADLEGSGGDQTTVYVYSSELTDKGSPVKSNTLLRAIIYPDSDDTPGSGSISNGADTDYDRVELTYYANGSLATRKDQRGTVLTYTYTPGSPGSGLRESQRVTTLGSGGSGGVDDAVRSITYAYDAMLRLVKVTSHADVTADPDDTSDVVNQVAYTYDGLGRLTAEHQEHDGIVTGGSHAITHTYDDTTAGNVLTSGGRLASVTYPNGRNIHWTYAGHNGIDDAISRANALADDDGSGDPGDPIVTYSYLGSGGAAIKDYPTPQVRLSYADGSGGDPYDASSGGGWDRFGRVVDHGWTSYAGSPADVTRFTHAYDHASNRLYSERTVYTSHSEVYSYDELHRLVSYDRGYSVAGALLALARTDRQHWLLDALGNQKQVTQKAVANYLAVGDAQHNNANELQAYDAYANTGNLGNQDDFSSQTVTDDNWDGAGAWSVSAGVGSVATPGIFLLGAEHGPFAAGAQMRFSSSISTTVESGIVFGYQDAGNYWLAIFRYDPAGPDTAEIWQVAGGTPAFKTGATVTLNADTFISAYVNATATKVRIGGVEHSFGVDGCPAGRVGFYSTHTGVSVDEFTVYPLHRSATVAAAWDYYAPRANAAGISVYNTALNADFPTLLRGFRHPDDKPFRVTFMFHRVASSFNQSGLGLVLNARDRHTYDYIRLFHALDNTASPDPRGYHIEAGSSPAAIAGSAPNDPPDLTNNDDDLWVRLIYDGSGGITVKAILDNTGKPSEGSWTSASAIYTSSNFDFTSGGGRIGFRANYATARVRYVHVETDHDEDTTWTTEYEDNLGSWGSAPTVTLEHDAAGNLTYDGVFAYTYDAWNRQVKVTKAYRNPASPSTVSLGSVVSVSAYDGTGRRVVKAVQNSGDLDATYHYYFRGQSVIEERNGSDMVLKHYVWAPETGYIDELVQTAVNGDPVDDPEFDPDDPDHDFRGYFALHNANYNVMAIVDTSGGLVERYEYTPYGERQVYFSAGANDPLAMSPTSMSRRVDVNSVDQPYGLLEIGHQGLYHDEEANLVYNRARMLHTRLGRFAQRDPLEYVDANQLYLLCAANPLMYKDPFGMYLVLQEYSRWTTLLGKEWLTVKTVPGKRKTIKFNSHWLYMKADDSDCCTYAEISYIKDENYEQERIHNRLNIALEEFDVNASLAAIHEISNKFGAAATISGVALLVAPVPEPLHKSLGAVVTIAGGLSLIASQTAEHFAYTPTGNNTLLQTNYEEWGGKRTAIRLRPGSYTFEKKLAYPIQNCANTSTQMSPELGEKIVHYLKPRTKPGW